MLKVLQRNQSFAWKNIRHFLSLNYLEMPNEIFSCLFFCSSIIFVVECISLIYL